jgi:hypothetical protein
VVHECAERGVLSVGGAGKRNLKRIEQVVGCRRQRGDAQPRVITGKGWRAMTTNYFVVCAERCERAAGIELGGLNRLDPENVRWARS